MKVRNTATLTALAAMVLIAGVPAEAADMLGPKDASQIVHVLANVASNSCPGRPSTAGGFQFDQLLGPDGSRGAFEIPAGKVLVITSIEILGFFFTPGDTVQTRVFRMFGPQGIPNNPIAVRESTANAQGRIF